MTVPNPPKKKVLGTRNIKLLITTLSLTTTLSGWALLALNESNAADVTTDDQSSAVAQPTDVPPTLVPTSVPTRNAAPPRTVLVVPPLSSLPVRGLREVGDPAAVSAAPAQIVIVVPPQSSAPPQSSGSNSGGGQQHNSPPPAPPPAPAPAPKPAPVGHTHGSHH